MYTHVSKCKNDKIKKKENNLGLGCLYCLSHLPFNRAGIGLRLYSGSVDILSTVGYSVAQIGLCHHFFTLLFTFYL
jgi:hypothetical protein